MFDGHTQESAVNFIVGFILPQKCSIKVVFLNICSKNMAIYKRMLNYNALNCCLEYLGT